MAKNNLPADSGAAEAALPAAPTPPTAPDVNPAQGGSYTADPVTGVRTLVTPSAAEPVTRKVQDPVTGAFKRIPVQE